MIKKGNYAFILAVTLSLAACAGNPNSGQAQACESGLSTAYNELDAAEAEGFGGTVDYTKAASLLAAAKIQSEFEKYPNCIDKVARARAYIRSSKGG
jgi:hypothetical protein